MDDLPLIIGTLLSLLVALALMFAFGDRFLPDDDHYQRWMDAADEPERETPHTGTP